MSQKKLRGLVGGDLVVIDLNQVEPNDWNPNRMTDFEFLSLKEGLREDGWLKSDAMLVWGKDEKKKVRNIIINGEHRRRGALEIGMTKGPAVFINGLTRAQAIALTIKLDKKRGRFDDQALAKALVEVQAQLGAEVDLGLSLGFTDEELMGLLAAPPEVLLGVGDPEAPAAAMGGIVSENPHVRMVPLYFSAEQFADFDARVRALGEEYGTETVTDTVVEALRKTSAKSKSRGRRTRTARGNESAVGGGVGGRFSPPSAVVGPGQSGREGGVNSGQI